MAHSSLCMSTIRTIGGGMDKVFYRLGGDINIVTLLRALSPEASIQIAPQFRVDDGQ